MLELGDYIYNQEKTTIEELFAGLVKLYNVEKSTIEKSFSLCWNWDIILMRSWNSLFCRTLLSHLNIKFRSVL